MDCGWIFCFRVSNIIEFCAMMLLFMVFLLRDGGFKISNMSRCSVQNTFVTP